MIERFYRLDGICGVLSRLAHKVNDRHRDAPVTVHVGGIDRGADRRDPNIGCVQGFGNTREAQARYQLSREGLRVSPGSLGLRFDLDGNPKVSRAGYNRLAVRVVENAVLALGQPIVDRIAHARCTGGVHSSALRAVPFGHGLVATDVGEGQSDSNRRPQRVLNSRKVHVPESSILGGREEVCHGARVPRPHSRTRLRYLVVQPDEGDSALQSGHLIVPGGYYLADSPVDAARQWLTLQVPGKYLTTVVDMDRGRSWAFLATRLRNDLDIQEIE